MNSESPFTQPEFQASQISEETIRSKETLEEISEKPPAPDTDVSKNLNTLLTKPKRRAPSTAYKPGQSGNPKGRPKIRTSVAEIFREALGERLGDDRKTKLRIIFDVLFKRFLEGETIAAKIILDRAYGTPPQDVTITNPDGSLAAQIIVEIPSQETLLEGSSEISSGISSKEIIKDLLKNDLFKSQGEPPLELPQDSPDQNIQHIPHEGTGTPREEHKS